VTEKAKRNNFSISGATEDVKCQCAVVTSEIRIASWLGSHTFIIANPVRKHDMIIGRDFLKKFGVSVNHSNDSLVIDDSEIHVNVVKAIANSWLSEESIEDLFISCDLNSLVCDFTTLDTVCDLNNTVVEPAAEQRVDMKVFENTLIKGNTQRLVKLFSERSETMAELKLFEPTRPYPTDCLVSRSAHTASGDVFCNVINAGDSDIVLQSGRCVGQLSAIERANVQFDRDVSGFVPLDVVKVAREAKNLKFKPDPERMYFNGIRPVWAEQS